MTHRYLSWGQETWDDVGHNAAPLSKRKLLGSAKAQHLQDSWLLKLYFQIQLEAGICISLMSSEAESACIFSLIYSLIFSVFFLFFQISEVIFMEEELQKCAAAAFEVSMSLNVVEYEQMLLPVPVAGATAPMEKAKLNCCASQLQVQQEQGQHRLFLLPWISVVLPG